MARHRACAWLVGAIAALSSSLALAAPNRRIPDFTGVADCFGAQNATVKRALMRTQTILEVGRGDNVVMLVGGTEESGVLHFSDMLSSRFQGSVRIDAQRDLAHDAPVLRREAAARVVGAIKALARPALLFFTGFESIDKDNLLQLNLLMRALDDTNPSLPVDGGEDIIIKDAVLVLLVNLSNEPLSVRNAIAAERRRVGDRSTAPTYLVNLLKDRWLRLQDERKIVMQSTNKASRLINEHALVGRFGIEVNLVAQSETEKMEWKTFKNENPICQAPVRLGKLPETTSFLASANSFIIRVSNALSHPVMAAVEQPLEAVVVPLHIKLTRMLGVEADDMSPAVTAFALAVAGAIVLAAILILTLRLSTASRRAAGIPERRSTSLTYPAGQTATLRRPSVPQQQPQTRTNKPTGRAAKHARREDSEEADSDDGSVGRAAAPAASASQGTYRRVTRAAAAHMSPQPKETQEKKTPARQQRRQTKRK